jgi:hypothetical protein
MIRSATGEILKLKTTPTINTLHKRHDQVLTHRLAFAASAVSRASTALTAFDGTNHAANQLIEGMDNTGWGWWKEGVDGDRHTRILPTCTALLALALDDETAKSEKLSPALVRLSSAAIAHEYQLTIEAALILLVLLAYKGRPIAEYDRALSACREAIGSYMTSRTPDPEGEYHDEHCSYRLLPGDSEIDFFTYPTDVIVALAALELHEKSAKASLLPGRCGQFAVSVVRTLIENVRQNTAFKARTTNQMALVDQYWIYLYLATFARVAKSTPGAFLWKPASIITGSRLGMALSASTLAFITLTGGYVVLDSDLSGALRATGGAASAVAASIVAALIYDRARDSR